MNEIKYDEDLQVYQQENSELSLKALFLSIRAWIAYLKSKWIYLTLICICGFVLGYLYAGFKRPTYFADSTFVLEESGSGGGLGQYAGLASMIGIDIGGSSNGIFQGDNIIELYRSTTMLRKTLLSPYLNNGTKELLVDRYIRFNNLRKKWTDKPELAGLKFAAGDTVKFSRLQDSILKVFVKDISERQLRVSKPDKKLSIIKVEVLSKDEVFAKTFNDNLVKNVNDFYVQTRVKKSVENINILRHQTDSVRAILNGAIFSSAVTLDATPNLNPTRQVLRAPAERSRLNAEANKAILSELIKNLELANISLRRDMPLIKIVDQPIYPLESDKVELPFAIIVGGILALIFGVMFFSVKRIYMRIMDGN